MGFNDWWDVLGTGIQSLFAWTTFNRDAFADNVGWRQNQKYQQKNYHISWISVARDDIRDMMSISVNRLNNFMIVNGLILGVAGSAITSASFNLKAPPYLVAAFLICVATSVVFLVLAIMFGIKGQNCAFTNTMKLLTWEMRPENPADYNHDYMSQAQWIEKRGLQQMFRIPGLMPNYATDPHVHEHELPDHVKSMRAKTAEKGQYKTPLAGHKPGSEGGKYVAEDFTALEHLEVSSTSLWYLTKFGHFMRLWMPYDTHCKYAMGMGMLALGHAGAYFTMGTLLAGGWDIPAFASVSACFAFVYMVALVIQQNFSKEMNPAVKVGITLILCLGPTLGVFAATTKVGYLHKYLWMACFTFHFTFWSGTCFATFSTKVLRPSRLGAVGTQGGFWGTHEQDVHRMGQENGDAAKPDAAVVGNGLHPDHQGREWRDWEESGSPSSSDEETDGSTTYRSTASEKPKPGYGQAAVSSAAAAPASPPLRASSGDAIAGHGRWPTDDQKFGEKVEDTSQKVKAALQQTIVICAGVWLAMLIWVIVDTIVLASESPFRRTYPGESVQPVSWGSPFIRPTRIACVEAATGKLMLNFVADSYNIHKVNASTGKVTRVDDCALDAMISDISYYWDGGKPWPVVLTQDGKVVDCQHGTVDILLKAAAPALLSVYSSTHYDQPLRSQRLVVSLSNGQLVQYYHTKYGWSPEYELSLLGHDESVNGKAPTAISVSGGRLLSFYSKDPDEPAVYRHDLATMSSDDGPWSLSSTSSPVAGGCAYAQANYGVVLPKVTTQSQTQKMVRLDFVNTHSAFFDR